MSEVGRFGVGKVGKSEKGSPRSPDVRCTKTSSERDIGLSKLEDSTTGFGKINPIAVNPDF